MAIFHEPILKAKKDETIGLLKIVMENLEEDRIVPGFDTYAELFGATMPLLNEENRALYNTGLQLGLERAELLRSLKAQEDTTDYSHFQLAQGKEAIKYWLLDVNRDYN